MLAQFVKTAITDYLSENTTVKEITAVSGGDIHHAFELVLADDTKLFIKCNRGVEAESMFLAEQDGLIRLSQQTALKVPKVMASGCLGELNQDIWYFLLLEFIDFTKQNNWEALGIELANLHKISQNQFGLPVNNYIGLSLQSNSMCTEWSDFWWNERLLFQLKLARANGYGKDLNPFEELLKNRTYELLNDYDVKPSLVHGDLWSGNVAFTNGHPCIFDPAVYFADREVDLAMTELFGGFPSSFYEAYQKEYPLSDGYRKRVPLYNLYHLLNHLNLFGDSYLLQVHKSIKFLNT